MILHTVLGNMCARRVFLKTKRLFTRLGIHDCILYIGILYDLVTMYFRMTSSFVTIHCVPGGTPAGSDYY